MSEEDGSEIALTKAFAEMLVEHLGSRAYDVAMGQHNKASGETRRVWAEIILCIVVPE